MEKPILNDAAAGNPIRRFTVATRVARPAIVAHHASMVPPSDIDQETWRPWTPLDLARRLVGVSAPWCVVGGWALDLWHGRPTRPHDDIEFTILAEDLPVFRGALEGLAFYTAHDGVVAPLPPGEAPPPSVSQIWCRDVAADCWRADMMIERGTPETWIYKRDAAITAPRADVTGITADGIRYLSPAAILLFKAKHRRPKDEADFAAALPKLSPADRRRLRAWLTLAHPDHDWTRILSRPDEMRTFDPKAERIRRPQL